MKIDLPIQRNNYWEVNIHADDGTVASHRFPIQDEAEEFWREKTVERLRKRMNMEVAGTVPLTPEKPISPQHPVAVTPPPSLTQGHLSDDEEKDAYEKLTDTQVARIEYENSLGGEIPFRKKMTWLLVGGIGAGLIGFLLKFGGC
jgi:hypothetical protein